MSSYGDFVTLSDECDLQTDKFLSHEVSDGIIAPSYSMEALEVLKSTRKGNYLVIQIDPNYVPNEIERKQVYGITFEQKRNSDAFFPFGDNIERARKSGVSYIAQAGGSIRDDNVIETCDKYNIAMAFTGIRLFHH